MLLALFIPLVPALAADDSATIQISAEIVASCSLSVPESVELEQIPASALADLQAGDKLADYAKNLTINASCFGTDEYELKFFSENSGSGCVGSDNSVLRFCLATEDGTDLTFENKEVIYTGSDAETIISITPARGSSGSIIGGKSNGTFTVTITPL